VIAIEELLQLLEAMPPEGGAVGIGGAQFIQTGGYDGDAAKILRFALSEGIDGEKLVGALESAKWWVILIASAIDMGEGAWEDGN
jgi:hypothetical protein